MATQKLLFACLRRPRRVPFLSAVHSYHRLFSPTPIAKNSNPIPPRCLPELYFNRRAFSTSRPPNDDVLDDLLFPESSSELVNLVLNEVADQGAVTAAGDSILPVRALVSLLDGFHDLTGWPWWVVIASSTVAMRMMLFPFLVLTLQKLKRISEILPQLAPPLPPPNSGRSYTDQFSLFMKEKRAAGCPSFFWIIAQISVQMPLFFCCLATVRRMCLDHHHGFDCGGTLWFQNLTEFSNGPFGPIFPVLIAGFHYTIVQLSFDKPSLERMTTFFGISMQHYKRYLEFMTLPLIFINFNIPQGSHVYWVTNSSLTIIQQLSLRHPVLREKLGLPPVKDSQASARDPQALATPESASPESPENVRRISAADLTPKQMLKLSVELISSGNREAAISLLQYFTLAIFFLFFFPDGESILWECLNSYSSTGDRLAIEKDPDHVESMIVLGQALLQEGHPVESAKILEHAASKLLAKDPTNLYLLIFTYSWAGVACIQQGKKAEGIAHMKRVAGYGEPDDLKSKAHYFDCLVMLAGALHDEGRHAEAAEYVNLAAAHNPAYRDIFERCAKDDESNFVSALVNSRRADY